MIFNSASKLTLLILVALGPGWAAALTTTWTGTGNWTATNWLPSVPGATDDAVIAAGTVTLTGSVQVLTLTLLTNSSKLVFSNWNTTLTASNITLAYSNATITHTTNSAVTTNGSGGWDPDGGIFLVCTNLTVATNALINANGTGYRGGGTATNGYGPGRGRFSSNYGTGGGYGGDGGVGYGSGNRGWTYDSATNPVSPGSGGSGGATGAGGAGGGYVQITANGTVTVEGMISTQGNTASAGTQAGGGSGGGILIQCGNLTGNGTIRTDGGSGADANSGGGGGGRIAIFTVNPTNSFNGQLSAKHGWGFNSFPNSQNRWCALPGTVYLSDWGVLPGALTNGGAARFTAGTGTAANVTVSNYTLFLEWSWETNRLKVGNLTVANSGKIMHCYNTTSSTNAAGEWDPNAGIFIECSNLTVAAGGAINTDGLGYYGNVNGYGPGGGAQSTHAGGGGYGGAGGRGSAGGDGGPAYGMATNPASPGSAGADASYCPAGGGYVKIVASGTVTVNGLISANGTNRNDTTSAGGSGGGILIRCGNLTGNGTIRADGGGNGSSAGGGGGGGRIAIYADTPGSFGGQMSAKNGSGAYAFQDIVRLASLPGTVYLSDWSILPGNMTNGGGAFFTATTGLAANVTISNYTIFTEYGWETNRLKVGNLAILNNGKIMHRWNSGTTTNAGVFIECSNLTVASGGEIDTDELGFSGNWNLPGYGPGGGASASAIGGGGGYGGLGGRGSTALATGGPPYGIASSPISVGSAGGGGDYIGACGGGYVKIVAAETVTVDGVISARGASGYSGNNSKPGGGSGGGIVIQCYRLAGAGMLVANGGNGGSYSGNGGGGGSGGRIAVTASKAPFYIIGLSYTVNGGAGGTNALPGSAGTVYRDFKSRGTVYCSW